ncbi:hypothetical protein PQX77_020669 [Marasmius sp. AFHP31]|nr:hypothetical protein PQX77_020669 [Marasmius sp. AFHP31]
MKLYEDIDAGPKVLTHRIGHVLFNVMTLEHEALHAETLLYMPYSVLEPVRSPIPDWNLLSEHWDHLPLPDELTVKFGPASRSRSQQPEADDKFPEKAMDVANVEYGWDNEHPKQEVQVGEFRIE